MAILRTRSRPPNVLPDSPLSALGRRPNAAGAMLYAPKGPNNGHFQVALV